MRRIFEVTATEYNRFLQLEIQLNKYKGLWEKKSKELKRLQDQLAYYKRKDFKRHGEIPESDESIKADTPIVNKKIVF